MQRINRQIPALTIFFLGISLALAAPHSFSQGAGASSELQQKVAALKAAMAQNQQFLRKYMWVETTDTILKGETKSTKLSQCQYGPDGTVQKIALGGSPPPAQQRGVKGRIVEKKKGEIKDYMGRVALLIQRYVPPDSSQMQASFEAGKTSVQPFGGGIISFVFRDYAKAGDAVTLTFDTASKKIQGYDVNTFLDDPKDVVTLKVVFDSLPDGTNHVAQSVLDATAKQIQIRTANSRYSKL
jgi:hypothetical protein